MAHNCVSAHGKKPVAMLKITTTSERLPVKHCAQYTVVHTAAWHTQTPSGGYLPTLSLHPSNYPSRRKASRTCLFVAHTIRALRGIIP